MSRVVVLERRLVAELLAGGADVAPGELVDEQLQVVARAVGALRAVRQAATDDAITGAVRVLGGVSDVQALGDDLEALRREGSLRRAA